MIRTFACKQTARLFADERPIKRFPPKLRGPMQRKLVALDIATTLDDLRAYPGHRLEALKGDRDGQYSIRVNDQWRVCFVWDDGHADTVEIVDYH